MEASMAEAAEVSFLAHFAALRDPRKVVKVLYPVPEILLLVLCGTIAGGDDFTENALWGEEHLGSCGVFCRFSTVYPATTR
jgi:hypothetical protein